MFDKTQTEFRVVKASNGYVVISKSGPFGPESRVIAKDKKEALKEIEKLLL